MRPRAKIFAKRRDKYLMFRKRVCRFCTGKVKALNYKDIRMLEAFISERGKILSSRSSGNCAKHQRAVVRAIKKARFISLLPYTRV